MKILYILHNADFSGANMSFFDFISIKKEKNYLVVFPKNGNDSLEMKFKERSIPFVRSKMTTGYFSKKTFRTVIKKFLYKYLLLLDYKRLKKIVDFSDYSLIHSNSIATQLGAFCAIKQKMIHIWTIREFMEEDYGYSFYNLNELLHKMLPYSHLICITNSIKEKWGIYSKKNSIVLYNGIKNGSVGHNSDCSGYIRCLIAGNLCNGKGQEDAIRATYIVKKKGFPICLFVYGEGENRDYLLSLIDELDAKDYIFLKGFNNNLFEIRKNIDIALVCSKKEALGRVTVEAMYSKNLVIGSNTGGTRELIIDGETGLLYQQGDYQDLANKIIFAIENKKRIDDIKQNALAYAKNNFDPSGYIIKLDCFYKEVLDS